MSKAPHLLYLVTEDWYFCSHRLQLATAACKAGYEVTVATRVQEHAAQIQDAGINLVPLRLSRRSQNPVRESRSLAQIAALYRRLRPDIVHHVATKPVIYGSLAAWATGTPAVVNALGGLGYVFSSEDTKARLLRPAILSCYRHLLDRAGSRVIVQNPDDLATLTRHHLVDRDHAVLIAGSGVNVSLFSNMPERAGEPLVVLPARMLRDKGVAEFVAAARQLKQQGVAARFALVGKPDPENPATIPEGTLRGWEEEGVIEYWGWREDMADVFQRCHIVCLPSYREGLPKALIEAAACGRAIVTTDVPGCRDVVSDGENGFLVPARDTASLALALLRLIDHPDLRARMGQRGRQRAVSEFAIDRVIAATLDVYRQSLHE